MKQEVVIFIDLQIIFLYSKLCDVLTLRSVSSDPALFMQVCIVTMMLNIVLLRRINASTIIHRYHRYLQILYFDISCVSQLTPIYLVVKCYPYFAKCHSLFWFISSFENFSRKFSSLNRTTVHMLVDHEKANRKNSTNTWISCYRRGKNVVESLR